jgi:uncharacterized protein YciI
MLMPLFAIVAHDRSDAGTLRADTRPAHVDHLQTIMADMFAAGPMLDEAGNPCGSIVIADFPDLAAARAFADADPYAKAGLFERAFVSAYRRVFP